MGLLLLNVNHIQNIQLFVDRLEKQIVQLSKIKKTNTLYGDRKPKSYTENQKSSKVGYGHDYIPGDTTHNRN
jgi:flagellar biosynthesis chaperone FliJ